MMEGEYHSISSRHVDVEKLTRISPASPRLSLSLPSDVPATNFDIQSVNRPLLPRHCFARLHTNSTFALPSLTLQNSRWWSGDVRWLSQPVQCSLRRVGLGSGCHFPASPSLTPPPLFCLQPFSFNSWGAVYGGVSSRNGK